MAHTPTPWAVELVAGSYKRPAFVRAGEKIVASCGGDQLKPDQPSIAEARENAEFIAKACNSHDALVDVAEEVLASATVETPEKLLAMARAALEAAKS
jgi:hypothetical protein